MGFFQLVSLHSAFVVYFWVVHLNWYVFVFFERVLSVTAIADKVIDKIAVVVIEAVALAVVAEVADELVVLSTQKTLTVCDVAPEKKN